MEIRRSQILANLLAEEGLHVRADLTAKTASFNTETRELVLPAWKHADKSLMNSLIAHEAAHALFTPHSDGMMETYERVLGTREITPTFHHFMNMVEDARIERKMKIRFKGLADTMRKGYKNFVELGAFAPDHSDIKTMWTLRLHLEAEKEKNPIAFVYRLNAHAKMGSALGLKLTDEEEAWYDRMMRTSNFTDVVKLAKEMYDYAIDEANTETPNSQDESDEPQNEPDETDTQDECETTPLDSENAFNEEDKDESDEGNEPTESQDESDEGEGEGEEEAGKGQEQPEGDADESDEGEGEGESDEASDETDTQEAPDGMDGQGGSGSEDSAESKLDEQLGEELDSAAGMGDLYKKAAEKNPALQSKWNNPEHESVATIGQPDWEKSILSYNQILKAAKDYYKNLQNDEFYKARPEWISNGIRQSALFVKNKMKHMRPIINSAVNRFERKKAAAQHAQAQNRKTGKIDATKMYKYKVDDQIFLNTEIMPNGKNHGVVLFLDWSGSMNTCNKINAMIDQTMIFASFAKRVGIKFRIYAFTTTVDAKSLTDVPYYHNEIPMKRVARRGFNPMSGHRNDFTLLEMFTDEMSLKDMENMFMLMHFGSDLHAPFLYLSGTPLNSSLMIAPYLIREFKQRNNLEKVSFAALTDGDSMPLHTETCAFVDEASGQRINVRGASYKQTARLLDWIGRIGQVTTTLFCLNAGKRERHQSVIKYLDPDGDNGHSGMYHLSVNHKRIKAADAQSKDVFIMDNARSNDGNYGPDALYAITAKAFDSAFQDGITPAVRKKMMLITNAFVDQIV